MEALTAGRADIAMEGTSSSYASKILYTGLVIMVESFRVPIQQLQLDFMAPGPVTDFLIS
jgi:hypothetical protein